MQTIDLAKEELKRVDHLFYVSLKYTRTCDVIRNIIKRLISSYDYAISAILEHYESEGKISSIPPSEKIRAELVLKLRRKDREFIGHYLLLRKIIDADFERKSEYRKHVTLIAKFDEDYEVDVIKVMEYFKKTDEYVRLIGEFLE
ncbi:hypothetical protein HOA59_02720 [archaeon]|jgi:hypothetical protein|nr:hypothetical protein [archaeon]MBT6824325.1 hypothetical protein [archaeon]MBT7106875.1 hypothetical protein [archaeon]MBT7297427.1 hypothetical protein [archaeon]